MNPYTALEWRGPGGQRLGFVVLGDPESVDELLVCARELGFPCGFMTDHGLFLVDARVDWVLSGVERGEG